MGNDGFSYFSRLASSTSFAANAGESQPEKNVAQEQQTTFSGRPMTSYDPANPYLASQSTSRRANPGASRRTTVSRSITTGSTAQYSPVKDYLANPLPSATPFLKEISASQPVTQGFTTSCSDIIDPPEDPFAALVAYQPISFEENRPQLYSGFGMLDDFSGAFPEELEAEPVTSQSSRQSTLAPVMGSPVLLSQGVDSRSQGQPEATPEEAIEVAIETAEQRGHVLDIFQEEPQKTQSVSRQDNPPANLPASSCGPTSTLLPMDVVMIADLLPLNRMPPVVYGKLHLPLQQTLQASTESSTEANPDGGQPVSPPPPLKIIGKVARTARTQYIDRPADKYLLRTNAKKRPYMCGYPDCSRTYKTSSHLRCHVFEHVRVSEYQCTEPGCGPDAYFRDAKSLKRHFNKLHRQAEPTCMLCNQVFRSPRILSIHIAKRHHTPSKK